MEGRSNTRLEYSNAKGRTQEGWHIYQSSIIIHLRLLSYLEQRMNGRDEIYLLLSLNKCAGKMNKRNQYSPKYGRTRYKIRFAKLQSNCTYAVGKNSQATVIKSPGAKLRPSTGRAMILTIRPRNDGHISYLIRNCRNGSVIAAPFVGGLRSFSRCRLVSFPRPFVPPLAPLPSAVHLLRCATFKKIHAVDRGRGFRATIRRPTTVQATKRVLREVDDT